MKRNIQGKLWISISSDIFQIIKHIKMKTFYCSKNFLFLTILLFLIILSGCANNEEVKQCLTGHTYGFLGGLWHGFIAPFDFIGMLFNNKITMYAQNNNGGFYALGFLLGSGGWGFFGGRGIRRVEHSRINFQSQKFDKAEIVE
jgi:hypothetical protein